MTSRTFEETWHVDLSQERAVWIQVSETRPLQPRGTQQSQFQTVLVSWELVSREVPFIASVIVSPIRQKSSGIVTSDGPGA